MANNPKLDYDEQGYRIEYRITGRFRKSEKRHVVDFSRDWNKQDAHKRLEELKRQSEYEMENRTRKAVGSGICSVSTPYYSDYDLLELRVERRRVTKWTEYAE